MVSGGFRWFSVVSGSFGILLGGFADGFGGFGSFHLLVSTAVYTVHHFSCKLFATNNKTKFSLNSYVFCQFLKINRLIC